MYSPGMKVLLAYHDKGRFNFERTNFQNKSSCTWIWPELGEDLMEVVSPANYGFTIPDELALVPTSKRL